jgi:hypothetical protein
MSFQAVLQFKLTGALIERIKALVTVFYFVGCQISLLSGPFATFVTHIRAFFIVGLHMSCQLAFIHKGVPQCVTSYVMLGRLSV